MDKLLIVSFAIFTLYVAFIWLKFGVLKSISDSWYHLTFYTKPLFTLALFGFAIPVIISAESIIMKYAGLFICYTAIAPMFKIKPAEWVHYIGAVGGVMLGLFSLWQFYGLWYVVILFAIAYFFIKKLTDNSTWWVEILAFYTIIICLLLN